MTPMVEPIVHVSLERQELLVVSGAEVRARYSVSTALRGPGEREGSGCTPRGWHEVRAKIGADAPAGAVFVGRRRTGEIWTPELQAALPDRDWVLSRILWLRGTEPGLNRGGSVDSMRRFIYIHGVPDTAPMGSARSHGCIRMRNADVIDLFASVRVGTRVLITEV